jgi:uncharacterized protein YjbI with pentapeptide repeats
VEVDGCRTLQELLTRRLARIGALVAPCVPAGGEGVVVERLRSQWAEECDRLFLDLAEDLKAWGLACTVPLEAPRYGIRAPIDLRGADLAGAVLCGAFLENVTFAGADLAGARFDGARCIETCFDGARCSHASFAGAECNFASFRGADCDHASFAGSDCTLAVFKGARLRHASFAGAVCFAAAFDGAFLADAAIDAMAINHLTTFGRPGELGEAAASTPAHVRKRGEDDDWFISELFPAWLRAAQVNCRIRQLFRNHGYFLKADEYQYFEMVCHRHLQQQSRWGEFCEWFFKDLMFGYGLKWKRPLVSIVAIILLWGGGFTLHFQLSALHGFAPSIGYGLYYSVISFTTLGLGHAAELDGIWPKVLLCSEALLGTILMPLFLLAYARKILQD